MTHFKKNYSYLSDGMKLSALDGSGEGLVYMGPFVYRKSSGSNAGSSLTLESAAFGGESQVTATPVRKPRTRTSEPVTPTSAQDSTA